MEEHWAVIDEFPNYSVSDLGNVMNNHTHRDISLTLTGQGIVKVGLVKGGKQYTRSVKLLVAMAFVGGHSETFDTPIQLDGFQNNNMATNLMWRPRWFAWKYTHQFSERSDFHTRGPIFDIVTRHRYIDIYEASVLNGLLFKDVWRSINFHKPVFPTDQVFAFVR